MTRRKFSRTAIAGAVVPALIGRWAGASPVGGVRLGVQTYSFRELAQAGDGRAARHHHQRDEDVRPGRVRAVVAADRAVAAGGRDADPADRREGPRGDAGVAAVDAPSYYEGVRKRFADAGITVFAYNYSFNDIFTDEEIDHGFEAAKALGAEVITASTTLRVAKRLVPFAEKHRMPVAMHNHSQVDDPNEFATPDQLHDRAGDVAALQASTSTSATSPPLTSTRSRFSSSITTASPTCT